MENKLKNGLLVYANRKHILHRFPNFKLYNNSFNIPNLIDNADYYVLKPKGRKSYLWFTYYKKDLLCLLIFVNNTSNIYDDTNEFYYYNINYDKRLCYNNVLLSGIYFYTSNTSKVVSHYFILDNVMNYNCVNLDKLTHNEYNNFIVKLNLYKLVLAYIINTNYSIYLGIISTNYSNIFKHIYKLDYKLYSIACYNNSRFLGNFIVNNSGALEKSVPANFKVYACISQDIYKLYVLDNANKEVFYDYALIDSYKTSVFMNGLFRNIKENSNLDLLEESDSEDEFENTDINKFVTLEKSHIIECVYNKKFKKWIPINLANNNNIIINNSKINFIIKKNKIFI